MEQHHSHNFCFSLVTSEEPLGGEEAGVIASGHGVWCGGADEDVL